MSAFQRWLLYLSTLLTFVSGVAYFWMKHFVEPAEPWAVVNHPLQPWALKAHILAAPVMLFAFGLIASQHIWRSLRSSLPTGRHSGCIAAYTFLPLVLTGYLIQVVTSEGVLAILSWTHLGLGVLCAGAVLAHRQALRGRRLRRRAGALPVLKAEGRAPALATEHTRRSARADGAAGSTENPRQPAVPADGGSRATSEAVTR